MAMVPVAEGPRVAPVAIPVDGGPPRIICADYCVPKWSSTGEFLVIPVEAPSRDQSRKKSGDSGWAGRNPARTSARRYRVWPKPVLCREPNRSRAVNSYPAKTPHTSRT